MALNDEQYELLCFLEQHYLTYGQLLTKEAAEGFGIKPLVYDAAFKNPEFRSGLTDRGIKLLPVDEKVPDWKRYALTEEQLAAANVLLDFTDTRSRSKKLNELGISTAKYQSWLRDPVFQTYLRSRAESALGDNQHEAHMALVDRVITGDINAIKYFNELTGRYVPQRDTNIEIGAVLMRIVEIVQKHVKDPVALEAIGTEMLLMSEQYRQSNSTPVRNTRPVVKQLPPVEVEIGAIDL